MAGAWSTSPTSSGSTPPPSPWRRTCRAPRGATATSSSSPPSTPRGRRRGRPWSAPDRWNSPNAASGCFAFSENPDPVHHSRVVVARATARRGSVLRLLEGDDGPAEQEAVAVGERVGDAGLQLRPLGGLGAGDVRAVQRAEVD